MTSGTPQVCRTSLPPGGMPGRAVGHNEDMSLLDAFVEFDAALEWALDDPLLADEPSGADAPAEWPQPPPAVS